MNASNPVVIGDQVFCSSAYSGDGSFVLKIKEDLSGYTEVWSDYQRRVQTDDPRLEEVLGLHWMTPIVHEGNLYAFSGRNEPDASFRCVEFATGKLLWNQDEAWQKYGPPSNKYGRGSFIQADGKLIVLGETGKLGLFALNAKKPEELAAYQVPQLRYPAGPLPPWPPNAFISAAKPTSFATISPKNDNRPRGQQPNSGFLFRAKTRSLSPVL